MHQSWIQKNRPVLPVSWDAQTLQNEKPSHFRRLVLWWRDTRRQVECCSSVSAAVRSALELVPFGSKFLLQKWVQSLLTATDESILMPGRAVPLGYACRSHDQTCHFARAVVLTMWEFQADKNPVLICCVLAMRKTTLFLRNLFANFPLKAMLFCELQNIWSFKYLNPANRESIKAFVTNRSCCADALSSGKFCLNFNIAPRDVVC